LPSSITCSIVGKSKLKSWASFNYLSDSSFYSHSCVYKCLMLCSTAKDVLGKCAQLAER
jgi:hypothetical protein